MMHEFFRNHGWLPAKSLGPEDHVFLTGAGSGIGRIMARMFGKMGCHLSLVDINTQGLEETRQMCMTEGIKGEKIHTTYCDLSSRESIKNAAASATAAFGTVTVLVNNAGVVSGYSMLELSDQIVDRTFAVNTYAHFYTIKEFLPGMIEKKRGHIACVSSMAAFLGGPNISDYTASKAGAFMCDESLRIELKKSGQWSYIKTSCICPYIITTGMFDGMKKVFPL